MTCMGNVGTVSIFQRRKCEVFYWEINQFSTLSEEADAVYNSLQFDFSGKKSCLSFYPNGKSSQPGKYLALYFHSPNYDASDCVYLTLGLKTVDGCIQKWFSRIIIYPESLGLGSAALIRRDEFLKRKAELIPSDCLTFVLFLSKAAAPEIIRDVADQSEADFEEENSESEKKGTDKVADDVAKLLTSGDRSDATIVVKESEYKVHSCILATRTPVFAALFEHDTLEKATRKITITDCEPTVFGEFLNYIYSGSVRNLTAQNALDLYRVSDKYLIKELKELCRKYIQDNLCLEKFCEAVQLATKFEDADLLRSSFDYCAKNFKVIIRSGEWRRFIEENPIEANEVLIRAFGPL